MRIFSKLVLPVSMLLFCCIERINEETAREFERDLLFYDLQLAQVDSFIEQGLEEVENSQIAFFSALDPKKRISFENDRQLQVQVNGIEDSLIEFHDRYKSIRDSMNSIHLASRKFLNTLRDSSISDEEALEVCDQFRDRMKSVWASTGNVEKETLQFRQKRDSLYSSALERYGKKNF